MAIDTSIYGNLLARPKSAMEYQAGYAALDADQQAKQMNALAMQGTQRKFAAEDAAAARSARLTNALAQAPDEESRAKVLDSFGMIDEATKLRAAPVERANKAATTAKTQAETLDAGLGRYRRALDMVQSPQQAVEWLKAQYADPIVGQYVGKIGGPIMEAAQRIPQDPQGFANWRAQAAMGIEKHMQEQRQAANDAAQNANRPLIADPSRPGQFIANQPLQQFELDKARASAAQNVTMGSPVAGVDENGNPVYFQPGNRPGVKPTIVPGVRPPPKEKPNGASMSPTLQKELIESDEMVASAQSVKSALERALELNKNTYSGLGALNRAKVRSNLPGQSPEADATIEFDNIIRESALSGMKSIFGGNPTEGERAILLEIQASAEKTPAQRKAILERAMAAADRRAQLNAAKAKAIREGTYLTDGVRVPENTPPSAPKPGTVENGYRFKGGDPSNASNWEKL